MPLKAGDWVELPFGKEDALRRGQVKAVVVCARMVAPWPTEQTKIVLRVINAPVLKQSMKADVPKEEQHIEQPEKTAEKRPVLMPNIESE